MATPGFGLTTVQQQLGQGRREGESGFPALLLLPVEGGEALTMAAMAAKAEGPTWPFRPQRSQLLFFLKGIPCGSRQA